MPAWPCLPRAVGAVLLTIVAANRFCAVWAAEAGAAALPLIGQSAALWPGCWHSQQISGARDDPSARPRPPLPPRPRCLPLPRPCPRPPLLGGILEGKRAGLFVSNDKAWRLSRLRPRWRGRPRTPSLCPSRGPRRCGRPLKRGGGEENDMRPTPLFPESNCLRFSRTS